MAWVVGFGILGTVAIGNWVIQAERPGGDRDGRILSALVREADASVPPNATILLRKEVEPQWDTCDGRKDTGGWQPVRVLIRARVDAAAQEAGPLVDRYVADAGWTAALHPSVSPWDSRWGRQLATGQAAELYIIGLPDDASTFTFFFFAQPPGPAPSGC